MMARIVGKFGYESSKYGKWIPIFLNDDPYDYVRTYFPECTIIEIIK